MQRVLFVDHATVLGGAEHSLLLLLKYLNRDLIEPLLACPPGKLAEKAREEHIAVECMELPRLRRSALSPWHLLHGARQLARLAQNQHCDLVCSNTMRASIYAAAAAQFAHKPLLWYVRDVFSPGHYVSAMTHRAASIIAVSQAAAAPLRAAGAEVHVIYNGIELDAFGRSSDVSVRSKWGIPAYARVAGIVGRVRNIKGQHHFIEAIARAHPQNGHIWGVIIGGTLFEGEEDYVPSLHKLAEQRGVQDRIVFAGHTDDVPHALLGLDMLVSCSIEPESFGRTVIEGMAGGLPVIAYSHGGPSELITDGWDGWLVEPRNIGALAERIALLANDAERCQAMGASALETAKKYDIGPLTRQVERVILSTINEANHEEVTPCA